MSGNEGNNEDDNMVLSSAMSPSSSPWPSPTPCSPTPLLPCSSLFLASISASAPLPATPVYAFFMQLKVSEDSDPGSVTTVALAAAIPSSSCLDTPALSPCAVAQQDKYHDLFEGGKIHKFVKSVLLESMWDCAAELCKYFREEFEIFAD